MTDFTPEQLVKLRADTATREEVRQHKIHRARHELGISYCYRCGQQLGDGDETKFCGNCAENTASLVWCPKCKLEFVSCGDRRHILCCPFCRRSLAGHVWPIRVVKPSLPAPGT